jgi:cytochrome b subunit of formate dehydrogenase
MSLITILVVLIVTGVVLWLVNSFIPMQSTVKSILNIVVVIVLIVWLLKAFGLFDSLLNIHV